MLGAGSCDINYIVYCVIYISIVRVYTFSMRSPPIFRWEGPFRVIQGLMAIFAIALFIRNATRKKMDVGNFMLMLF